MTRPRVDLTLGVLNGGDRPEPQWTRAIRLAFGSPDDGDGFGASALAVLETGDRIPLLEDLADDLGLTLVTGTAARPFSRKVSLLLAPRLEPIGRPRFRLAHGRVVMPARAAGPRISAVKWNLVQEVRDTVAGRTPTLVVKHALPSQHLAKVAGVAAKDFRRTGSLVRRTKGATAVLLDANVFPDHPRIAAPFRAAGLRSNHEILGVVNTIGPLPKGRPIDHVWGRGFTFEGQRVVDLGTFGPRRRVDHGLLVVTVSYLAGRNRA